MNHPMFTMPAQCFAFDSSSDLWVLSPDGILRRLGMQSGAVERRHVEVERASTVNAMAVDVANDRVALCDDHGVKVMEYPLACGDVLELPYAGVDALDFSPDGELLGLGLRDDGVVVLSGHSMQRAWRAPYSSPTPRARVRFSRSGAQLAANTGDGITCYQSVSGGVASEVAMAHLPLFDHAGDAELQEWGLAVEGGAALYTAEALAGTSQPLFSQSPLPAPLTAMTWGRDGLWVGTRRGEIMQVEPYLETFFCRDEGVEIEALEISPDGRHLASLWADGVLYVLKFPSRCR